MKFTFYTAAFATLACLKGYGQIQLEFEVASIKPAPPAGFFRPSDSGTGGPGSTDPTMFRCANCTLSSLILKAFALQRYQLPGQGSLPGNAFVISAKVPEGATPEQFLVMLQNLLKDRFELAYHFDKKDVQGYHLILTKNGPKLMESKEPIAGAPAADAGDAHREREGQHGAGAHGAGGWAASTRSGLTFSYGGAQYRGDRQTTGDLALVLANQLAKPVDDQTGLTGKYDIRLSWAGETAHSANHPPGGSGGFDGGAGHDHGGGGGGNASARSDTASGPTLFEALQSQLGLKLAPASKSTARIFVVDHVEKAPTAN